MAKKEQAVAPPDFEHALGELEALVASMERDDLPLEQALLSYQRGVDLLRLCQHTLANAEQRIRVLEEGQLRVADARPDNSEES